MILPGTAAAIQTQLTFTSYIPLTGTHFIKYDCDELLAEPGFVLWHVPDQREVT